MLCHQSIIVVQDLDGLSNGNQLLPWHGIDNIDTQARSRTRTGENAMGEPRPLQWTLSWALPWTPSRDVCGSFRGKSLKR